MPRYYFHLHNDIDVPDDEGAELPDLAAAIAHAKFSAREVMGQILKDEGRITFHHSIDVEDEDHQVVARVMFSEAAKVET